MDSDHESQHVIDTPNDPMDEDNPQKVLFSSKLSTL